MPWASSRSSPRAACASAVAFARPEAVSTLSPSASARACATRRSYERARRRCRAVVEITLEPAPFGICRFRRCACAIRGGREAASGLPPAGVRSRARADGGADLALELGDSRGVCDEGDSPAARTSGVTARPEAATGSRPDGRDHRRSASRRRASRRCAAWDPRSPCRGRTRASREKAPSPSSATIRATERR